MDKEQNEYIAGKCDVVVYMVRRFTNICASASTDQGSPATDMRNARKKKRLSNPEEEVQNLGDLHVNSGQLRRCSKYFDTCLGERWAGTEIITSETPVHLTLDVHTDVKYYRDCFSRMCSSKNKSIPNVKHCLKLLQVASQISYLELIENCVRYLTSIPWSCKDEEGIRNFANSMFYPSDCAADLSARLGLPLSNTGRQNVLLDVAVDTLCTCFNGFVFYGHHEEDLACSRELFSSGFWVLVSQPQQSFAEKLLKHVNDGVKKIILDAEEHPEWNDYPEFENVRWILSLLLETRSATGLVEYIVDESPLSDMLELRGLCKLQQWVDPIHFLFKEVIAGHLLLKTSTRYMLIKEWTRIFVFGKDEVEDESLRGPYKTLSTFVMTFPYETQKKIILDWMAYEIDPLIDEKHQHFAKIRAKWFASLLEKISSLEP